MSTSPRGTYSDTMRVIRDCFLANETPPPLVYAEMPKGIGKLVFDLYREHTEDIHPRALPPNEKRLGDYHN